MGWKGGLAGAGSWVAAGLAHAAPHPHSAPPATCRAEFHVAADDQLEAVVAQMLRAEEVDEPEVWGPILCHLARESARTLSPMAAALQGQHNPNAYIKVC